MSLIDPKHLAAPFKDTMHIVTIVFAVLLFAVFRLATGGIEISSPADELRAASKGETLREEPKHPITPNESRTVPTAITEAEQAAPAELHDIERALGIKK